MPKKISKIIGQSLENFVSRLVEEKGLENLDPEVLEQVKSDLTERVDDRINALILSKVPPEKLKEFEELVNAGDEKKIQAFCQANILDLDQALAAELLAFRNSYITP